MGFVVYDVETSGLNKRFDQILQFAAIRTNEDLEASPEMLNKDAYGAWMFKLNPENSADIDGLLDAAAYTAHVESEAH